MAVDQAARFDRAGHRLGMSVNISRYDLVAEDLASYVEGVLALHGFPPDRLTLEVTESALGGDPQRAERCVRQLRTFGVRVSIDDFGVGYSSMSQLLGLAIDELEIDKSFLLRSPRTPAPRPSCVQRSSWPGRSGSRSWPKGSKPRRCSGCPKASAPRSGRAT
jgi:EAL domain-containing protein (putative c-di-GMP-specific phosphodiesterase class I)